MTKMPSPRGATAPLEPVRWVGRQAVCLPRSRRHRAGSVARGLTAWSSLEAVLASRTTCNLIVVTATSSVAAVCVAEGGIDGFITNLPALAVVWGALYGLIRLGRGWRGVRPPRHLAPGAAVAQVTSWRSPSG
jgi:hypothetical protein